MDFNFSEISPSPFDVIDFELIVELVGMVVAHDVEANVIFVVVEERSFLEKCLERNFLG